jgi:methylenetetrahydrofolate reductase (NADH)
VALLRRRAASLDDAGRAALGRVLTDPTWELIPLKNAREQAAAVPAGGSVSVTASPAKGIEATVELAAALQAGGLRATPHLSARMIRDDAHLRAVLDAVVAAGIEQVFVVGGDADEPGAFLDGLSLLEAMADLGRLPGRIGIPCYPQGHPDIPDDKLLAALHAKARFASSMTTQLCFDAGAIADWLAARRAEGITLPVRIGLPGVAAIPKLLEISARIGVRDASRFVVKNTRFVGELLKSGGLYKPTTLLEQLAPLLGDPTANVIGLHVYTFNNVRPTVETLGELRARVGT